jgi:hypothetical protein
LGKIIKAKRAGGFTQVTEHLLSKCKALSSNPSTTKKKKKKAASGIIRGTQVLWRCRQSLGPAEPFYKSLTTSTMTIYSQMIKSRDTPLHKKLAQDVIKLNTTQRE